MKKIPKPKKGAWFVKVRGSYLPASGKGVLTYVPFIAILVADIVWFYNSSQNLIRNSALETNSMIVVRTLCNVVIAVGIFALTGLVMTEIARRKS